ncbi:transposase family protein [Streptomyces goshikiensis]|uniref:transposase family protein n=1 Tax=Streptomyces goshikiensis TaxID=1942 RepID=UPI0036D1649B
MMVDAACCGPPGPCPLCQHPAALVHSRYWRYIAGLPAGGRQVIVRLRVRRFFCDQSQCRRRDHLPGPPDGIHQGHQAGRPRRAGGGRSLAPAPEPLDGGGEDLPSAP